MKKIFIFIVLIGIAWGVWTLFSSFKEEKKPDTSSSQTTVAVIMDIEETVEAKGQTIPITQTDVKSEITGKITRIFVESGDIVKKEQTILELDTTSLEADLREVERSYDAYKLRLNKAKRHYQRLKELSKNDYAQKSEFEDAETELQLAKLELDIRQAKIDSMREKLAKATIRAPHGGVVINMDLTEGQVISGATSFSNGTSLMQIADIDDLMTEINLNEIDINKVVKGDIARIAFDAIPDQEFSGTVTSIAPKAENKDNVRSFPIEVSIDQKNPRIKPGISATITLPLAQVKDAVAVLVSAVFLEEDQRIVYLQKDTENFEKIIVETGINNTQYIEIKSGLQSGDNVSLIKPTP